MFIKSIYFCMLSYVFVRKDLQKEIENCIMSTIKTCMGDNIMATTVVQLRVDESSRILASRICEAMGMDLQTYLRMCIAKLIQEMRIPFDMALDQKTIAGIKATIALDNAAARAEKDGYADMTLDEINAEIDAARKEADARKNNNSE